MKPKRVLIITDISVWPPVYGNKARIWNLMNNLRSLGHDVSFLGLGLREESVEALSGKWGPGIHNIARVRARAEKPLFQGMKRILLDRFYERGIGSPKVDHWFWPYMERGIAKLCTRHQFDAVIAEYVFFSKALLQFGPEVLKIIDTHDIWTGRREKLKALKIRNIWRYLVDEAEETRGLQRADVVMSIQENESKYFRNILHHSRPVVTVGYTVEPKPLPLPVNSDILFIGSPNTLNIDGLMHFIETSLPVIRKAVPDAQLLVAGTICEALPPNLPAVKLLGKMENVESAYRTTATVINPIRTGTGLKIKTIEALAFGRALVTTPSGADGLEAWAGKAFLVAEDPGRFTAAIMKLLTNRTLTERLGAEALKFVKHWNELQIKALQLILTTRDNQPG